MNSLLRMAAVVAIVFITGGTPSGDYSLPSPYGWRCLAGACVRQERTVVSSATLVSFSTCKLTCGSHGTLWPRPTKYTKISKQTELFQFENLHLANVRAPDAAVEALVREAWGIFLANLQTMAPLDTADNTSAALHDGQVSGHEVQVDITVSRSDTVLTFQTLEVYTLGVTTQDHPTLEAAQASQSQAAGTLQQGLTRVTIIGNTFFGARHALETLSQLMAYNEESMAYEVVSTAAVVDEPVYPYRGLLLDTARNFFTVASIKGTLDAMAANKLNTFHWHISDSQSFPLQLHSLPKMAYYGAFSAREVYTPDDVRDVVAYARVRGIRVVPEMDAPGHVGNGWQWGEKEGLGELLACFNKRPWTRYCAEPPCGQLNLANPHIYTVLAKLYKEYLELFGPLELIHYGGDEVNLNCWNSTKAITDMMVRSGAGLSEGAYYSEWSKFQQKASELVAEANGGADNITGIIWTSKLTEKQHVQQHLDKSKYIIQVWTKSDDKVIKDLLELGYRLILSNSDAWYLDCGFSSWMSSGLNWCSPYRSWQQVYDHRPSVVARVATGVDDYSSQILGGEVAAWSEQIDSASLDYKVWPRSAAFAERVWSDPAEGWSAAESRLVHHRQRMVERGVMADRLKPRWCHQHDAMCTVYG